MNVFAYGKPRSLDRVQVSRCLPFSLSGVLPRLIAPAVVDQQPNRQVNSRLNNTVSERLQSFLLAVQDLLHDIALARHG